MKLAGSTAFVTGANRGLGRHFAEQLLARGATVYAGARDPGTVTVEGVTPVRIDLRDPASVTSAAEIVQGANVLINNAGSSFGASLLTGDFDDIAGELDTHYLGTLRVIRAFVPQLTAAPQAAVLNVLSVLSWFTMPAVSAYSAAKSAEWSLTNAVRQELAEHNVLVAGLHVGYMDTDMARHVDGPKSDPAAVATLALDGLEAGQVEILADELSQQVRGGLAGGVTALYPQFA